jgi:DNA-binding SARP family transcriptional activator
VALRPRYKLKSSGNDCLIHGYNHNMNQPTIRLFGHIQIEWAGQPVELKARKALALLAWLAVDPHAHDRERLATFLWPDADATRSRANLRRTLWTLNQTPIGPWIDAQPDTVAFRRENADIDVVHFERLLNAAATDPANQAAPLAQAVEQYSGAFLADLTLYDSDEWDSWARTRRQHYHRQALAALHTLTQQQLDQGDFAAAVTSARRHLAIDHLDEPAQQQLLLALAQSGQRTTALTEYDNFCRLLAAELDVAPSPATVELVAHIRSGAVGGGAPILPLNPQTTQPPAPPLLGPLPPIDEPFEQGDHSAAGDHSAVGDESSPPSPNPYRGLFAFC